MRDLVASRCCCSSQTVKEVSLLNWKRNGAVFRNHRIRFSPTLATLGDNNNDRCHSGTQGAFESRDKKSAANSSDVMKLFNDTQQNMLYLNKQRVIAIEEVQKTRRVNEFLAARVAQLEAEHEASAGECEILQKKLEAIGRLQSKELEDDLQHDRTSLLDPSFVWGELVLRVDSMAMTGVITLSQATGLRNLVRKRDAQAADVYLNALDMDDRELSSRLLYLLDPNKRRGIHVVHICTEMAPIAEAGPLATYITSLCTGLRRKGHLVEVILPKYASVDVSPLSNFKKINADLHSYFDGQWHQNKIWTGVLQGIAVTLIEPNHPRGFFERENVYDYDDDFERFTYFCRAALEYLLKLGKQPNILHIHNWHTATVAPLFWDIYEKQGLQNTRIMFTCHDFKNQCLQEPKKLSLYGLSPQELHRPDRLQDNSESRLVNLLKGGIIYSNKVTTVSPLYARDVLSTDHGHGMDSTLTRHKDKFVGIANGIDQSTWNPRTDPTLPSTYSSEDLSGKLQCKAELRRALALPDLDNSIPLVGYITPTATEQDLELLRAAMERALSSGAQFVFVGSSRIPRVQAILEDLQRKNLKGHFEIKYDDKLAHQVIAASDILVCPCVSEPSGQWPLIAMRYGTVPVSREVYGVRGSVIDADETSIDPTLESTGFTFCSREGSDLANALGRALELRTNDPHRWKTLIENGMKYDSSWDGRCANSYEAAYWSICVS